MEVSKELRADIERTQTKLKIAIRNHQMLFLKLKADPDNVLVKYDIKSAQNDIISIGLDQKELLERLRSEHKIHQKNVKTNATKAGLEDRRCNLTNILTKSRKQNLTSRSASVSSASTSEDSLDVPSAPPSPQPPLLPHELSQVDFLGRMGLCTHEIFKELQNKRVERKRRSTANPQFLYGNRWDQSTKRKKNTYLMNLSPPNTRQAVKNKLRAAEQAQQQQRVSPPLSSSQSRTDSRSSSPVTTTSHSSNAVKKVSSTVPIGLNIPNLPSGLTIERVNGKAVSPDSKICIVCRTTGAQSVCESCNSSFHISCHNRPLIQQPRHCPKCLGRRDSSSSSSSGTRDVGALSVPPSMTVLTTYVPAEVKEKSQEKRVLLEQNKNLRAELNQLERRAEQLQTSLRDQRDEHEEMLDKHKSTECNIRRLLDFINTMKGQPTVTTQSLEITVTSTVPSAAPSPASIPPPSPSATSNSPKAQVSLVTSKPASPVTITPSEPIAAAANGS